MCGCVGVWVGVWVCVWVGGWVRVSSPTSPPPLQATCRTHYPHTHTHVGMCLSPPPPAPQDEHDVALWEHYGTSELLRLDTRTGQAVVIGPPRMYIE